MFRFGTLYNQHSYYLARYQNSENSTFLFQFQYMLCFEGHHVTTLGEITSKDGNRTEIQELESISRVVQEGKSKANDIRGQLKTLEATSNRMTSQYNKAQNEINDTFQYYTSLLEERKAETLRELDSHYSVKQRSLGAVSQKAQETIDKIYHVSLQFLFNHKLTFKKKILSSLSFYEPFYNRFAAYLHILGTIRPVQLWNTQWLKT